MGREEAAEQRRIKKWRNGGERWQEVKESIGKKEQRAASGAPTVREGQRGERVIVCV